jgi:HEAT repeat protein
MFDFILSTEKKIAKNTRRLTNRDAQPEDRESSAQWLANEGSPQSMLGLLARFDLQLEHDINNQKELDYIYNLCVSLGDKMHEPALVWLRQCKAVSRPLALIGDLQGEEAAIQAAYEVLQIERSEGNEFNPHKKKAVLIWLAERRHDGLIEQVAPFLGDFDEGVRYAAVEAMAAQQEDAAREPLLTVLTNAEEESNRLRIRVCEFFAQRGWPVGEAEEALAQSLPDGFSLRGGRIARA